MPQLFSALAADLVGDERPWLIACEWVMQRASATMTWALSGDRIEPRPCCPVAAELDRHLRAQTSDPVALAEAVAVLIDRAPELDRALWCWRDGEREFVRIEPRPTWA